MRRRLSPKKKKTIRLTLLYMMSIALLSALAYGYRWVDGYLQNKLTAFELREIEINGLDIMQRNEVLAMCGLRDGEKLLTIRPAEVAEKIERSAYVKAVSVVRSLPSKLRINVLERRPVAFIYGRGLNLIDEEGVLLPVPRSSHYWNLPFITGVKEKLGSLGEVTVAAGALRAVEVLNYINLMESGLKEAVAEVDLSNQKYLQLRLIRGGALVRLDQHNFSENLFVLSKYMDLYLAWDDLDKFEYVDVRFDGQLIVKNKES